MPKATLTKSFVSRATCNHPKKKVDYFDDELPGFLLEVRQSGGKTFYLRYRDQRGREHQYKIGTASVLTVRQARRKARDIAAQAALGNDPQAERVASRSIPTVSEFARERYLPFVQTYKRSWQTDEQLLRIHLLPRIGKLFMDEVTAEHLQQMLAEMKEAGYAPGTCARPIIIARYMFSLARKWKIPGVLDNPASGFPLPKDVQRTRFLNEDEIERLVQALQADVNRLAANAILLLLLTGARRNEITHAKWEYVDLERGTLLVPISKSGKSRIVVLNSAACDVMRSLPQLEGNPYVFPAPATGRPSPSLFFPWDRIRKRASIPDVRLHDLRHSFASVLVNQDYPLYNIQKLLGHANPKTTQRYAHLRQEKLARTAEAVGELVTRLTKSSVASGPEDRSGPGSEDWQRTS